MNFSDNGKLAAELAQLASSAKLLLMLDFDGTISPIVARPQDAQLDQDLGKILEKLSALPNTEVWIVSGRSLADLKEKVPFTNLIGSHGLECPFLNEKEIDNDDILQLKNVSINAGSSYTAAAIFQVPESNISAISGATAVISVNGASIGTINIQ